MTTKLSRASESALIERAQAGDKRARDELVMSYYGYVIWYSKRYPPHMRDDMQQVAIVGVIKAVDSFDPAKGASLVTLVQWCVRGEISHWRRRDRGDTMPLENGPMGPGLPGERRRASAPVIRLDAVFAGPDGILGTPLVDRLAGEHEPADDSLYRAQVRAILNEAIQAAIMASKIGVKADRRKMRTRMADVIADTITSDDPMTMDEWTRRRGISRQAGTQLRDRLLPRVREMVEVML